MNTVRGSTVFNYELPSITVVNRSAQDPPATARTTCEIRLNPRTFFMVRGGGSDNAVQNVYTAVCGRF